MSTAPSKTKARALRRRQARTGTLRSITLRERGLLTLPKSLRDRYGLERGDALSVIDLGGVFVLSPQASGVDAAANEIAAVREAAGVETGELLSGLQSEREQYIREHYPEQQHPTDEA